MVETPVVRTVAKISKTTLHGRVVESFRNVYIFNRLNKSHPDLRGTSAAFIQHYHFAPSNHAEQ